MILKSKRNTNLKFGHLEQKIKRRCSYNLKFGNLAKMICSTLVMRRKIYSEEVPISKFTLKY